MLTESRPDEPAGHGPCPVASRGILPRRLCRGEAGSDNPGMTRTVKAFRLLALLLLPLLASCGEIVGGSRRPAADGYTAVLVRRLGKGGTPVEAKVAWRGGSERREEGGRVVVVRPDRKSVHEREGGTWKTRPMLEGDGAELLEGPYPFRPIRFSDEELTRLPGFFPGEAVLVRKLGDAAVGVHPCDVLRIERTTQDGGGVSETRYYARDLDGLVVRRELVRIRDKQYAERIGTQELRDIRAGPPPELFEPK